jgi:D-psicose/D-tagatose/L-ribulose 3-epimerase
VPELTLCNELLAADGLGLPEQCAIAAKLGYVGLELAPGTLGPEPHRLPAARAAEVRRIVEDHGLRVTGLHWLLFPYPDLSITDPARGPETRDVLMALTDLCAALGGRVMVHGSPTSRVPPASEPREATIARVADLLRPIAAHAGAAGITYCLEPLAPQDTAFVNTVAEAVALVERVDAPALRTMIDTSAAGRAEAEPVADVIRRWMPTGWLAHVHVNDTARGAPGTGRDPFPSIVRALRETGWARPIGMEPFVTCIDATTTAAIGAATIRACWEAAA